MHIGQPTNGRRAVTYALAMAPIRMAVVGAGSWGTTVASLAAENTPTVLWARRRDVADTVNRDHRNPAYLGERDLSRELRASASLEETVAGADVVVMAVPSQGFREVLTEAAPHVRPWVPVVSLSKGLEQGTLLRMSEVANEVLPGHPVAVLTGPNLAGEIASGQPAASVVAIDDAVIATALQGIFSRPTFRVYTNSDVVGCELAGVVKNVIAIASGIATGMGFGDNTRATLVTRGLAEMTRLAVQMGGSPESLAGLAGMGDLIATCSSTSSRNTTVGLRLGRGEKLEDIIASTSQVAEGVRSSRAVLDLARRHGVDMPITEQVVAVCHEGTSAADGLLSLMTRRSAPEVR
jgi:glycerol-3-phosphate dehydrogenase (NAD(P)+)